MLVLVTGATGFVGQHLVPGLIEAGHEVRVTLRSPSTAFLGSVQQRIVPDLAEQIEWQPILQGVDAVVHLSGLAHVIRGKGSVREQERFYRANVVATGELLKACLVHGVKKLVFMSTLHVVASHSDLPLTEKTNPKPDSPYAGSKWQAEQLIRNLSRSSSLAWTILRPPLVYGRGQKANMARLVGLIRRGCPLPFGAIHNQRSFIGVDNLCHLILATLNDDRAHGQLFHCSDGEAVSTSHLIRKIGEACGRKAILIPVPERILRIMGQFPGMGSLTKLSDSLFVDQSHVTTVLGWRPPWSLEEGLVRMLD